MTNSGNGGVLADVTRHLGGIFRHMLPGILVVAGAKLAYPEWFTGIDLSLWPQFLVLAAITLAVGNAWFAVNRYGFHQALDWALWRMGLESPARTPESKSYLDDLGKYASRSLHIEPSAARAQLHVAFRASIVLLILTLGELSVLFGVFHSCASPLSGHRSELVVGGLAALMIGMWQMAITRRIDHYVVTRGGGAAEPGAAGDGQEQVAPERQGR